MAVVCFHSSDENPIARILKALSKHILLSISISILQISSTVPGAWKRKMNKTQFFSSRR